jgi:hypothetical protein
MDATLAWEIVGSVAAVAAIPAGLGMGIAQLRGGRKDAQSAVPTMGLGRDADVIPVESATGPSVEDETRSHSAKAEGHQTNGFSESTLVNMRSIAKYRDWDQLRAFAISNPSAAVLGASRTLTFIIYKIAYTEKYCVTEDWTTQLPLIVLRMGADRRTRGVIEDMQQMRDRVECGRVISRSDALEYIDAAEAVLDAWLGEEGSLSDEHRAR